MVCVAEMQIIATSLGIFLAAFIGLPLMDQYSAWKADPAREKIARRNWRGVYVPDLRIIRVERALKAFGALFLMAGMAINFIVMGVWTP